ncbi:hypothetical protein CK203_043870 [Vitis vinifera]|uniref:Uncharacterized protein n=1 Tax=Vitis vinifera TaxID=29760 RepID=A0A438HVL0_VITVI|nr:hypothetical protein CK203_043870 [Vitis vinifera]
MIHVAARWTHTFNQNRVLVQSSLQKVFGQGIRTHLPMVLSAMVVAGHHHPTGGCQRSWEAPRLSEIVEVTYHHSCPFALQVAERGRGYVGRPDVIWRSSGCDVCECRVPLPEGVRIGECATCSSLGSPDGVALDSEARHVSSRGEGFCCPHAPFVGYRFFFVVKPRVEMGMFRFNPTKKMSTNKDAASSSAAGQSDKDASGEVSHPFNWQFAPNLSLKAPGMNKLFLVLPCCELGYLRLRRTRGAVRPSLRAEPLLGYLSVPIVRAQHTPEAIAQKGGGWEHFILKDLPFYTAMRKADARARKALLNEQEEKRQEGTLRKAPGDKRSAPTPLAGVPARKKKRVPAARRLALLAEEANLVNQPGSPHPDADVVGASCTETLSHMTPLTEQTGVESQGLPPCEHKLLALYR